MFRSILASAAALLAAVVVLAEPQAIHIGNRLELFVDHALIEKMDGVELKLHPPRPGEVVLRYDKPWEAKATGYYVVFQDGSLYRMYYRGADLDAGGSSAVCYAESRDGIHWTKPDLGLVSWEGSTANNILFTGRGSHNFAPVINTKPGASKQLRYLALGRGEKRSTRKQLYAFASEDALHWRLLQDEPVMTEGAFDSLNIAFWDERLGRYRAYFRIFDRIRGISMAESEDFLHWTVQGQVDTGDGPPEHFYTNSITPYFRAPHIYFGFPKRFFPERQLLPDQPSKGISEAIFFSSRDGIHFDRTFPEALIRPGRDRLNWGDRNQMVSWGLVQTGDDEMSIYYGQHNRRESAHMRRGVFRLDGIASAHAGYAEGTLLTKPIEFEGQRLTLNYATSAGGSIRVEMQRPDGTPIPGFSIGDAPELFGDEIAGEYRWSTENNLGAIAGTPVRLKFVLRDADVYSYRFE